MDHQRAFILLVSAASIVLSGCAAKQSGEAARPVTLVMETAMGDIGIEVYPERAPITAANFLSYVDNGYFDGAAFYRTVYPENDNNPLTINVIQGGVNVSMSDDFAAPLAPIAHEPTSETGLRHIDGALSMARSEPGTAQSELFISIGENPVLDHGGMRNADGQGFAVFGAVTDGMDVVRKIHQLPADAPAGDPYVEGQILTTPVAILSIRRLPAGE